MTTPAAPAPGEPLAAKVLVIGHRGACAWEPEHTLASYARAMDDGADFIEPDLVMTRDGAMVARHEHEIGDTTDVASHPEFAGRRTHRIVDGRAATGWFTEDFTLAELKTLRARERLPELRGTAHDGRWPILTFEEVIDCAAAGSARLGRAIGIMPEIKHGAYFRRIGRPMEEALLATLAAHAHTRSAPVAIQSFEVANLQYLRHRLGGAHARRRHPNIRLLQLLDEAPRQPGDVAAAGGSLTYAQMMTPAGLREVARHADAIGPPCHAIIPRRADGTLGRPTTLVRDAHLAGLEVWPYTFRPENLFLAKDFWRGTDPHRYNAQGAMAEIGAYLDTGIDGFFTDDPALGRRARDAR